MKNILLVILSIITTISFSQTNLVPNSDFKQVEKKIKGVGQINVATPWTSPTLGLADLYVTKTKIYEIGVPVNAYGEEAPMEGDGYAGIVAYSYKNKVPRSYLQVKLTEKLEEGKEYCVKYHVSLADLSKYACDHLGIALTNEAMTANNSDVLQFESFIESTRLKVYEKQFYWTPICGKYKAKGGEEFITIGNFTADEKLTLAKVKRPRGFTKPQTYDAYYYVDNVSVVAYDEGDKCDCDVIPGMENAETVTRDFNSDKSVNTKTLKIINTDGSTVGKADGKTAVVAATASADDVDGMILEFNPKSYSIVGMEKKLDKVVNYLKANADVKIIMTGYIDESESGEDKLDGKRVSSVYKYIVSKGVVKERIQRELGGDMAIDEKQKTKNMRVEIAIDGGEGSEETPEE
jgi:OmpA-OmpF porin, OOP family